LVFRAGVGWWLLPRAAVGEFAEDVEVADVAGGFLDDVVEGPADGAGGVAEGLVVGVEGCHGGFGEGPFGAVGVQDGGGGVGGGDAPVGVGVFGPQGGQVGAA